MENLDYKTRNYTEESWWQKYDAPLPLEAYGEAPGQRNQQRSRRKQEAEIVQEFFNRKYNKKEDWKPINPHDMTDKSFNNFRWIPGSFVTLPLSLTAKSIYPVMCCEDDFEDKHKEFQISKETIGAKTGIASFEAVDDGLTELKNYSIDLDGFDRILYSRSYISEEDRQSILYKVWFPRRKDETLKVDSKSFKGGIFQFHRSIIESGVWAELTNRQKVFWMGLRSVAEPPPEVHEHAYDTASLEGFDSRAYQQALGDREYDVWAGSRAELLRNIGIKNVNIYREVVKPLEEIGMIEQLSNPGGSKTGSVYKVYFAPESVRKQRQQIQL